MILRLWKDIPGHRRGVDIVPLPFPESEQCAAAVMYSGWKKFCRCRRRATIGELCGQHRRQANRRGTSHDPPPS